jgi:hypothetical protein
MDPILSAQPEVLLLQLLLSRLKVVQLHGLALVKMEEQRLPVLLRETMLRLMVFVEQATIPISIPLLQLTSVRLEQLLLCPEKVPGLGLVPEYTAEPPHPVPPTNQLTVFAAHLTVPPYLLLPPPISVQSEQLPPPALGLGRVRV